MNVKTRLSLICFFLLFVSFNVNAFNSESCKKTFKHTRFSSKSEILFTTTLPTNISELTSGLSQTLSSTGNCSALNASENAKISYVKENYRPLQIDIAKGQGEYLDGYLVLLGCSSKQEYKDSLKQNYEKIYADENQADFKNMYISLSKISSLFRCRNANYPEA